MMMMEARFGGMVVLLVLLLVSSSSSSAAALGRQIPITAAHVSHHFVSGRMGQAKQIEALNFGNDQLCLLCEEYAAEALDYLADNKTQIEIMDLLHQSCSRLATFKEQCITLVDYYAPLFLLEVSSIEPEKFCKKVSLCKNVVIISSQFQEDSCGMCRHAVSEILVKLQDPDTQMEILELLLKGCSSMENYAAKCKKMVFEYGPLVLANAERFLETTDICAALHACNSKQEEAELFKLDSSLSI